MPGPLTKSVCVLYLTFSRANSMLCLPFAQRPAGTGGCLPTGGGSRASHHARCRTRAGPAGLEEQGWASLVHFRDPVSAALSIPWVLASQGSGSAGLWGQGWLQGWAWRDPDCSHCLCSGCRSTGLHHCLWCTVESGLDLMLCGGHPRALAPRVPMAPSALWHGVPGGSGVPGAPRMQSPALGAEPAVVLAIVSVQCLAQSLTAVQWWG